MQRFIDLALALAVPAIAAPQLPQQAPPIAQPGVIPPPANPTAFILPATTRPQAPAAGFSTLGMPAQMVPGATPAPQQPKVALTPITLGFPVTETDLVCVHKNQIANHFSTLVTIVPPTTSSTLSTVTKKASTKKPEPTTTVKNSAFELPCQDDHIEGGTSFKGCHTSTLRAGPALKPTSTVMVTSTMVATSSQRPAAISTPSLATVGGSVIPVTMMPSLSKGASASESDTVIIDMPSQPTTTSTAA